MLPGHTASSGPTPCRPPLFIITLNGTSYVNVALPFGCHTSGAACMRIMSGITWIMSRHGYHALVYVDDFVGCEATYLDARRAFDALIDICAELGLALAPDKCLPLAVNVIGSGSTWTPWR